MKFLIKHLIKKHDVISFDIFDTLIERTVINPSDIFLIVGNQILGESEADGFLTARQQAEREARKHALNAEVTLDDIYECLSEPYFGKRESLKLTEIQTEIDCCIKKESMADVFQFALDLGKSVFLVSDMYLSSDIIGQMIGKCGIAGYNKCYVSCEEHCNKINGELFRAVLNENGIESSSMLHIGDSLKADFLGAHKAGIESMLITRKNRLKRFLHDKGIGSERR